MSPRRTAAPGTPEALEEDLRDVAKRRLSNCFLRADDADEREKFPTLASVVRGLVDQDAWRRSPRGAVGDVIRRALDVVPEFFTGRSPEQDKGRNEWAGKPERHIAELLYGYRDSEIESRYTESGSKAAITYDRDYYPVAVKLLGQHLAKKTIGRALKVVRQDIAQALLALRPESLQSSYPAAQVQPVIRTLQADPSLIDRKEYVSAILRHIVDKEFVIYLWGEAGTGKTTLAEHAAKSLGFTPVVWLHANDPDLLRDDLASALIDQGLEPTNWSDSYCRVMFRRQFSEPRDRWPTPCVVVDNLDNDSLLAQLVPEHPSVPFLVTMRDKPTGQNVKAVELHDFTEVESCRFVGARLKGSDAAEVLTLARILGYRPLALDHATRFISESLDISLRGLVDKLASKVSTGLSLVAAATDKHRNLVTLYSVILGSTINHDIPRAILDSFLVTTGRSAIVDEELLFSFMQSKYGGSYDRIDFRAGLRMVESRGLLREVAHVRFAPGMHPVKDSKAGPDLAMHPLTWEILRGLREMEVLQVEGKYLEFLSSSPVTDAVERAISGEGGVSRGLWHAYLIHYESTLIDLPRSWIRFHCVDEHTWMAVMLEEDGLTTYTVRYDVFPNRVYKIDSRVGKRMSINYDEAVLLHDLVIRYYENVMPVLNNVMNSDE